MHLHQHAERETPAYETPEVCDYGTLTEMTAALHGGGPEDGAAKALIHLHISAAIFP